MSVSCPFVFIGKYFVICNNIKWMKLIKLVQNEGSIEISGLGWIKSLYFHVLAKQVVTKFKINLQMAFEFYVLFYCPER